METNYSSGSAETGTGQDSAGTVSGPSGTGTSGTARQSAFDDSAGRSSRTSLREELSNLKADLDTLVSRAATLTDRELSDARDKLMARFGTMRESARGMASGMASKANDQFSQGMDVTTTYVKDNPMQSIAIAAGVGLVLGVLLRGGSSDREDR